MLEDLQDSAYMVHSLPIFLQRHRVSIFAPTLDPNDPHRSRLDEIRCYPRL